MLAQAEACNTPGPAAASPGRHAAQQHSRRRCPPRHEARGKCNSGRQRPGTAHARLLAFPQQRPAHRQALLGLRSACRARAARLHDALHGGFTSLSTRTGPPPSCACCRLRAHPRQAGSMQVQARPGALPAKDSMVRHHAQPTPSPPSALSTRAGEPCPAAAAATRSARPIPGRRRRARSRAALHARRTHVHIQAPHPPHVHIQAPGVAHACLAPAQSTLQIEDLQAAARAGRAPPQAPAHARAGRSLPDGHAKPELVVLAPVVDLGAQNKVDADIHALLEVRGHLRAGRSLAARR